MPPAGSILICSDEPMVAALVGMLVELTGREPVFVQPGEAHVAAIQRLQPSAVVVVDVAHDAARSDLFFATIARRRIAAVIFGRRDRAREIAEIAGTRRAPWFFAPPNLDELHAALDRAAGVSRRQGDSDRRAPEPLVAPDGTSIFEDTAGCRWMVYDRRAAATRRGSPEAGIQRVFVSDSGEQRTYVVTDADADSTLSALENQLSRALPV